MEEGAPKPLTIEAARKRLGLAKEDHLADYLPHWKEVEMRLAGMAAQAEDPAAKASFEKDLAELREVLKTAMEAPDFETQASQPAVAEVQTPVPAPPVARPESPVPPSTPAPATPADASPKPEGGVGNDIEEKQQEVESKVEKSPPAAGVVEESPEINDNEEPGPEAELASPAEGITSPENEMETPVSSEKPDGEEPVSDHVDSPPPVELTDPAPPVPEKKLDLPQSSTGSAESPDDVEEPEPLRSSRPTETKDLVLSEEEASTGPSRGKGMLVWLLIVGLLGGAGYWGYQHWVVKGLDASAVSESLQETQRKFEDSLEKRRWDEAEELIQQMKAEGADEKVLKEALASVEQGRIEERGQQIAFLVGNAQSALEAGQLSEAEKFCLEIEKLQPDHPKLNSFRQVISESKLEVRSLLMVKTIEKAIADEDWKVAAGQLEALVEANGNHPRIPGFRETLKGAEEEMRLRREKAAELVERARELDKGTYSEEALALMEEAVRLDPSEENRELYQRMASYGKVVRVPEDHSTVTEALKAAKTNDRVFVSKGTYQEVLVIPPGVELVGESPTDTIIECPASVGAVITIGSEGKEKVRVSALTLRHTGLVNDEERFPILAIDGGNAEIDNVIVNRASGHGIAVLNGGRADLKLCKVTDCGWDGIAVTDEDSRVSLSEVVSEKNLHHGIDFWNGASGQISESVFTGNGRTGILAIAPVAAIRVEKCKSTNNREVGLVFSEANGIELNDCDVHENLLGGVVFDQESKGISLTNSRVTKNGEAGIVFVEGVEILAESGNTVEGNKGKQIWKNAVFPARAEDDTVSPPPPPPLPEENPKEN